MERHLLVAGNIYRADSAYRTSSAGVPEGDPLSVVAMYCMCRFFALCGYKPRPTSCHWRMPTTGRFWQVHEVRRVLEPLPFVAQFLECCALPISPSKCWMWSATAEGRRRTRAAKLNDARIYQSSCRPLTLVPTCLTVGRGRQLRGISGVRRTQAVA